MLYFLFVNSGPFNTPILFLIFNRPETTERVFQKIRVIKPKCLFISADGPRLDKPGEEKRCEQARTIVQKIDWDCNVKTKFSDKNQGCKIGVSSGIDWFFQHVEEGIILEDDCLPDLSFFNFCETLLEYYRNDERVMHIGGVNFQDGKKYGTGSYYFSSLNHVWGWATWQRAWKKYDINMKSYPQYLHEGKLLQLLTDAAMCKYWKKNFDLVFEQRKDTWDYQWQYASFFYRGLAVIPNENLVSNIGFDDNATHTIDLFNSLANRPTKSLNDIKHPSSIQVEQKADIYTFNEYFSLPKWKKLLHLIIRYF